MAIKRIPRTFKSFEYEGVEFALRPPTTEEVVTITRMMTAFQRSLKKEIADDVKEKIAEYGASSGDMSLLIDTQKYAAKTLVVDFETKEQVFGSKDGQENIDQTPGDFVTAAWLCYSSADKYINAMHVVAKLGKEFEPVVRDIAFVERKSLIEAISNMKDKDGVIKYTPDVVQDFINNVDGKVVVLNSEGKKEIGDPSMTEATTTSNSEEISFV